MGEKKQTLRRQKASSLKRDLPVITVAAMGISLLLILASTYWAYGKWISGVEDARLEQFSQQQADQRAAGIARYAEQQQQQLDLFAQRASTQQAASTNDPMLKEALLKSLQAAYPHALSFKMFTLDRTEHLQQNTDRLTFTELDMINRAEKRVAVAPEALRVDKKWYLHFVASLAASADDPVIGTLLVTLPANDLFALIQTTEPDLGKTELLRKNPGRNALIFTANTGEAGTTKSHQVGSSEWLVNFTPSELLATQAAENPLLLIALMLILAVALLALVYWITGRLDPQRIPIHKSIHNTPVIYPPATGRSDHSYGEQDILDIQVAAEDEGLLGLQDAEQKNNGDLLNKASNHAATSNPMGMELPDEIFRAYDIRGVAEVQITPELAEEVGKAVASAALTAGDTSIFVARDARNHSPELCEALIRGILSTGCHVINLGAVPTPLMYFATCELPDSNSGVMVTASHNSAEYNGFKMVINGHTLVADDVQEIKVRIQNQDYFDGRGRESSQQIVPAYIDRIFSDVALAGDVKLVIDAGNGITSEVAPLLFEELGCEVEPLFCELDGNFPNHDPDPTIEANLQDLIRTVQTTGADLGVAFDGDGDRLVLVTPKGQIIWPDRLLMLFARDIVSRNPGADVLFDVKCTRELNSLVSSYGGRPIMWKAGHSNMKTKMQETGALLGGEMSGHIFIKDRWYGFDDGMYAAARLLEIMTLRDQDIDSLFESFPALPSTPELKINVPEARKFAIVEQLIQQGDFQNGKPITIDGLRVDFSKGWGLVRASNTSAALTLRFEAETESVLAQLQQLFKRELLKIDSTLDVPF